MPQIGPLEILIVAVLALVVFGPEKLPEIARSLGKGVNQIKRMASEVKSEFDLSQMEADPAASSGEAEGPAPDEVEVSPRGADLPKAAASV